MVIAVFDKVNAAVEYVNAIIVVPLSPGEKADFFPILIRPSHSPLLPDR